MKPSMCVGAGPGHSRRTAHTAPHTPIGGERPPPPAATLVIHAISQQVRALDIPRPSPRVDLSRGSPPRSHRYALAAIKQRVFRVQLPVNEVAGIVWEASFSDVWATEGIVAARRGGGNSRVSGDCGMMLDT